LVVLSTSRAVPSRLLVPLLLVNQTTNAAPRRSQASLPRAAALPVQSATKPTAPSAATASLRGFFTSFVPSAQARIKPQ